MDSMTLFHTPKKNSHLTSVFIVYIRDVKLAGRVVFWCGSRLFEPKFWTPEIGRDLQRVGKFRY